MSDFRYNYLSISLYLFAISVVILKNDLENKIIHVLSLSIFMYKILSLLPPNYLKILPYTICWKIHRIAWGYCRSGFATLPPELLQEQSAVVFLWGKTFSLLVVSPRWTWWTWWFMWFEPHEHNILRSRENWVVLCSSLSCLNLSFFRPPALTGLFFPDPYEEVSTQSF
jgi:hypothetical protein